MKKNILASITALIFLALTTDLWFCYKGVIILFTDLKINKEIYLQYKEKESNNLIKKTAKFYNDKGIYFNVDGKKIYWFKINLPEKNKIKKVIFHGLENKKIELTNENEYVGEYLEGKVKINWYNIIVISAIGYYFYLFLYYYLKNGFPKDDPKLPKMMNIEFLRILFTFCIIIFHILSYMNIFSHGRYGVEFFFILSGFLFCLTYDSTPSVCDFMKKKIIRFTPIIVFCSFINGIFKQFIDFSNLSADWFFWGSTGLFNGTSYCGVAWYISVLFWVTSLYFYMLKTQRKETVYTIMAVLTFFSYAACVRFGWETRLHGLGGKENIGYVITQALARGFGGIGLGFFIGLLYLNRNSDKNLFKKWQYTILEACFLILPCISMFYIKMFPSNPMMLNICFAGLIYLFVIKKGSISQFFEKPVFAKISKYALVVYLSHFTVALPILRHLNILPSNFSSLLTGGFVYIVSFFIVGFIIHHTIELPATRALKKWLD